MELNERIILEALVPKGKKLVLISGNECKKFFQFERNISQTSLAKLFGVTKATVNGWFQERWHIPIKTQETFLELKKKILDFEARTGKKWGE